MSSLNSHKDHFYFGLCARSLLKEVMNGHSCMLIWRVQMFIHYEAGCVSTGHPLPISALRSCEVRSSQQPPVGFHTNAHMCVCFISFTLAPFTETKERQEEMRRWFHVSSSWRQYLWWIDHRDIMVLTTVKMLHIEGSVHLSSSARRLCAVKVCVVLTAMFNPRGSHHPTVTPSGLMRTLSPCLHHMVARLCPLQLGSEVRPIVHCCSM